MIPPQEPQISENNETALEDSRDIEKRRRMSRISNLITVFALTLATVTSGCIWHRKGREGNPFLYDDNRRDAIALFPGSIDNPELRKRFEKEFELSIFASITTWFAQLPELGRILFQFDSKFYQLPLFVVPPVLQALLTSETDIEHAVERAEGFRKEREKTLIIGDKKGIK